jgi:ribosome biogenesis GTPase
VDNAEASGFQIELAVDAAEGLRGRVLKVHGLNSTVRTPQGDFQCSIRGLLKSLATEQQNVVVAGDWVAIKPQAGNQAVIMRVEPRANFLDRTSRGRQQILATNIDQALIVTSLTEPEIKPNLIDRFLIVLEKAKIQPIIIFNKVDLVHLADFQPIVGVWGQLGYPLLFVSAVTGQGIAQLQRTVVGRVSVVVGQSGVGKSSLLNAIEPGLNRRVAAVSEENNKGRHTTTYAEFIELANGGHIVDTPGIRQFQLWDVIPEEVEGYFRDLRCYTHLCRFPNCTHTHESQCAVKHGVAEGQLDLRRYESYCQIRTEE